MTLTQPTTIPETSPEINTEPGLFDAPAELTALPSEPAASTSNDTPSMRVRKRNGTLEPVDLNKIVNAVARAAEGLLGVDPMTISARTIAALANGATTRQLDELSINTAAGLIVEEPNYSKLAARMLSTYIDKEVRNQNLPWFSESVTCGHALGLISDETEALVQTNAPSLNAAIDSQRDRHFEFFGLRTVYDRYLLRHPETRKVIETPQYFFMRVACGLSNDVNEAIAFYDLISSLAYLPSSPTLFNSGTTHAQMSSCYLLDSPEDSLEAIYRRYSDIAQLSKFAGGIGVAWHRIRSKGSLIQGTNGLSNGIVPWLKTLDSSVAAVNQGGRRKGAACVYLETWHADIEQFLELRDNTGDHSRRTHHINLANWVPDLFMERVQNNWQWSLFDPKKVPELVDTYGDEFRQIYEQAERDQLYERQIPAQQLYSRMMRTLAETGNGWMTFKDSSNTKCNQTGAVAPDNDAGNDASNNHAGNDHGRVVHLSNLCTEIIEVTSKDETAVCNLGSVNLSAFTINNDGAGGLLERERNEAAPISIDFTRLGDVVQTVIKFLDRVIDINFYPTDEAASSNSRWRPVGLGLMGLQDVFFKLGMPFDSPEARQLSRQISEHIYFNALWSSTELAEANGAHDAYDLTRAAGGDLQFDLWGVEPSNDLDWPALRERVAKHGLRNSLLIAIAPTATIAAIAGCSECIEPQVSNLFKRETLSGEFLQINRHLVSELKTLGLWDAEMIAEIKLAEGSIQGIERIPERLRAIYRTAWELPQRSLIEMAADRGAFIDQSQSLNLFIESPTIGKLSSMYMYAWQSGLKTTYYLRSRPATRINQATSPNGNGTNGSGPPRHSEPLPSRSEGSSTAEPRLVPAADFSAASNGAGNTEFRDAEALACSLENPETCEACQ